MGSRWRADFASGLVLQPEPRRQHRAFSLKRHEPVHHQESVLRRRGTSESIPARSAKEYRAGLARFARALRVALPYVRGPGGRLVSAVDGKSHRALIETQ